MDEGATTAGPSYRTPGPLPSPASGFVGREAELSRVRDLLRRSRLVTITGTGGVGKTRLALRAAATAALSAADDVLGLAQLDIVDAIIRLQAGEPDLCCASAASGLARLPQGELWCTSYLEGLLALGLFLRGDHEAAKAPGRQALAAKHRLDDVMDMAFGLGSLAFIAAGEGQYERTAWLFGASAPPWERTGRWYTGSPVYEALHRVAERAARDGLGDDRFWRLCEAGEAAPLDEAVARALRDTGTFDEPA